MALLSFGSTLGFCTPLTLLDTVRKIINIQSPMIKPGTKGDLLVLKPTIMIAVPLFLERLTKGVIENLRSKSRLKQLLYQNCYAMKIFYRKLGFKTPILDKLIFKTLRNILGGRLELGIIGGAYVSRNVEEFANINFCTFRQGYGATETSAAVLFSPVEYLTTGAAGSPLPHCEVKLIAWEEGNCNPDDQFNTRGEIAISSDCIAMGYYKQEKLTAASFVTDPVTGKRWYLSGDIALVTPDGSLKIIDRKKDIIKLQHGEYVSLVKVESTIAKNDMIDLVCVAPTKSMVSLVALIIPNRERTKKYLLKEGIINEDLDIQDILENSTTTNLISDIIKSSLKNSDLNRHEFPTSFFILPDIWTPESNLITPTLKLKRVEINKQYAHLLM
ncbi:hypothetical protein MXB_3661 [Myxobolus squamalis]|nr:hypothetical protein MXB_3661 [Myxobolus squamalis]